MEGEPARGPMYFATLRGETSVPSLSSSPATRSCPHSGFFAVTPSGPAVLQHHPEPPILVGELQSLPALLSLVHLQLLLQRDDPEALVTSAQEQ